ncbi:MAG: hypothetical protein JO305_01030 [Alphaproteobacteria bacterium]|nr:hypothetical protein [Alphaproteobacteria bacterium]
MIRSALLLFAGVVAAACFACTPSPPELSAGGPATGSPPPDCDQVSGALRSGPGGTLASRVAPLSHTFDVRALATCDPSPCNDPTTNPQPAAVPNTDSYAADIKAAYDIAPPFFRAQLCSLSNIFIVDSDSSHNSPLSWGVRKRSDQKKFIGLSVDNWRGGPLSQSTPLATYEMQLLDRLLQVNGLPSGSSKYLYTTFAATPDTRSLAILDILAHEMGHIVWWDQNVAQGCTKSPAYSPQHFQQLSWSVLGNTARFHDFGMQNGGHLGPSLSTLVYNFTHPLPNTSPTTTLGYIYNGDPTYQEVSASVFATVAQDEDFIETFKYLVLTRAGLQHFNVAIGQNSPIDVVANLNASTLSNRLARKGQWIQDCVIGNQ